MLSRRLGVAGAVAVTSVVLLSACGASGREAAELPSGSPVTLNVVASTSVYGDIVKQIGGDKVAITAIVADPNADPHSYEASTQNQLALSKADVVVENGGGYDDFVDAMLKSAHNPKVTVLNAVDISGKQASGNRELNEHVWYDFPTVERLSDQIVAALSAGDSANAATFSANAVTFKQQLQQLQSTAASIKQAHGGARVAVTEPVPLYLLQACGLDNQTPAAFSAAIEEGTDVSPAVLKETVDLFTNKRVKLLAYNEQASGPQTEQIRTAAEANNVAVVPVTETLPAGTDYLSWMRDNLTAIRSALG